MKPEILITNYDPGQTLKTRLNLLVTSYTEDQFAVRKPWMIRKWLLLWQLVFIAIWGRVTNLVSSVAYSAFAVMYPIQSEMSQSWHEGSPVFFSLQLTLVQTQFSYTLSTSFPLWKLFSRYTLSQQGAGSLGSCQGVFFRCFGKDLP